MLKTIVALLRASHFPQTLAMTALLGVSAWLTSVDGLNLIIFVTAVFTGQLSVGWVNDLVDASLDSSAARSEKPVVAGALKQSTLKRVIAIVLMLTIPLSIFAAGWIGGMAHLTAIASAQVYNLYLSRTAWSWLPYALSFSLLPLFVAQAASRNLWPESSVILLFTTVGVIAHLLNAVPDIEIDRGAGKGGLAVSLGRTKSLVLTAGLFVVALAVSIYLLA